MSLEEVPLQLQRNAFNPRDRARAGDLWRLFQDAAVLGSSRRGWNPQRYRDANCAFIVRGMTAVHHEPTEFGDDLRAKTWVSTFKRDMMSDRQVRIVGPRGLVAAATQRWVHVSAPLIKPTRASPELRDALPVVVVPGEVDVTLPPIERLREPLEGREHTFAFQAWFGWMDPLAHANHPTYIDWADEALARIADANGLDPHALVPVAEEVSWRSGVVAPETVTVATRVTGRSARGLAFGHRFVGADGRVCAEATTIRGHLEADQEAIIRAFV